MYDLHKLCHFVTICETGSFIRAAEILGISQSALTRSIQSLETTYNVRLFVRGRGGVKLTNIAGPLLEQSRVLLRQADVLEQNLRRTGDGHSGRVAFGFGPLIGELLLPDVLLDVLKERPGLEIITTVDGAGGLVQKTLGGELDFCCCAEEGIAPAHRIDTVPIARIPLCRLVRRGHPLIKENPAIDDGSPVILGSGYGTIFPNRPHIICNNYNLAKKITLSSNAIWIGSKLLAVEELKSGQLVALPTLPGYDSESRIVIVRGAGRNLSPAAKYVMGVVRKFARMLARQAKRVA